MSATELKPCLFKCCFLLCVLPVAFAAVASSAVERDHLFHGRLPAGAARLAAAPAL